MIQLDLAAGTLDHTIQEVERMWKLAEMLVAGLVVPSVVVALPSPLLRHSRDIS